MPLTRLKNEFLEEDGVRFVMADEVGNTVACESLTKRCEIMPGACISLVPTARFSKPIAN